MAHVANDSTVHFPSPKCLVISVAQTLPLYKSESFLRQKYLEEMLSSREISALTFSVRSTVMKYLKLYSIPLRPEDQARELNKGQRAYGEQRVKRRDIEHKRELENIEKIKELRRQGFSYHKIARIFNSMGIPTKNKKTWHSTTVMKILNSNS
jgi:hypothetical protein